MKQCQALVEITLRLCAFCCDLARVRTEPVINRLARVAACTKNKRQNGSSNCMTGGVHNERMTVIGSIIAVRSWPRTADELNTCGGAGPLQLPEKSVVRVARAARSHDQIRMKPLSIHAAVLAVFGTITTTPNLSYSAENDL